MIWPECWRRKATSRTQSGSLAPAYGAFSEGLFFDDLAKAKALLGELSVHTN